ncbi:6-bladed beta-propeller [Candidatus Thiothrix anitrata]|uniref:6-bladed beta-propeller n=1 Tax=Candidatus Thiothrix anitrata TaxID=2823902 RepID=A0ABX7X362_9GAMM|nr:6-bladed beta-propeller [Candidatus Thiothrix anitrata]QTR50334.1 6-bladed beta-propeller [Candidatus Thiothrix anitrata]
MYAFLIELVISRISSGGDYYEFPYTFGSWQCCFIVFLFLFSVFPFNVWAEDSPSFISSLGNWLRAPGGVVVNSNTGVVYVADSGHSRIQKFTDDGVLLGSWGRYGSGDGQFSSPQSIAIGNNGDVYVLDYNNARIQHFASDGTFISKWGSRGSGDGQFLSPRGIAVNSNGDVYVADKGNDRIQYFSSEGAYIGKWGVVGSGDGQFSYLSDISIDSDSNVYVADQGNNRIQKFTGDGIFLNKWGGVGWNGRWRVRISTKHINQ